MNARMPTLLPALKKLLAFPSALVQRPRVRIAPSPTGLLHLGTARTALFNFLFAKRYGGTFVLRIEDTDIERSKPEFERDIAEQLRWLGISWDEGIETGGAFGPYRQSERLPIYERYLQPLLEHDRAYFCFCSEETLAAQRETQRTSGEIQRYSGACQSLAPKEARQRAAREKRAIVRLRMPEEHFAFEDLVRGEIAFDTVLFGDIALAKLDGKRFFPLYNFAVAVDDAEMRITHVLRGDDHIANTPKQMIIARLLGLSSPQYAHFSMILAQDRSKLSKRHGATSVRELREAGYFPETIVNFLALLGWNPGTDQELFTLQELIDAFTLDGIQSGGAIWNQDKLEWFNRQWLGAPARRWLTHDALTPELEKKIVAVLAGNRWHVRKETIATLAATVLERAPLANVEELLAGEYRYFFEKPRLDRELLRWKDMADEDVERALDSAKEILEPIPEGEWTQNRLERDLMAAAESLSVSGEKPDRGRLLWPVRVALSGKKQSPGPFDIAAIIGKEETLARIQEAQNIIVRPK